MTMDTGNGYPADVWTVPVYFGIVLLVTILIVVLSSLLGERGKKRDAQLPYESGMNSTGEARIRFNVQFYIVAMVFLVFDVETVFVITWAIDGKELGWTGYAEIATFIVLLLASLLYLARVGALDWRRRRNENGKQP